MLRTWLGSHLKNLVDFLTTYLTETDKSMR